MIEDAWRAHRPYLVNLAYSMLRDIGAAEDAAQEAFARLAAADVTKIDDLRGWLIVVTGRICLDQIGSARGRQETLDAPAAIDIRSPTPARSPVDPADRVTLDDEVRLALLVVLQRLTPAERVAFVLHDIFGLPYDTVARAVGRSVPACRQLAHRARRAIRAPGPAPAAVDPAQQRLVTERFISACANGDLDGLLAVLAPDVTGGIDLGPSDRRSGQVVQGGRRVANTLLHYFGSAATLVEAPANAPAVLLGFVAGRLYAVINLSIRDGAVAEIHVVADPAKLAQLEELVRASAGPSAAG